MSTTHKRAFELFQRQADGRLPTPAQAELVAHLEDCSTCRADVILFTRLTETIPSRWSQPQQTRQTGHQFATTLLVHHYKKQPFQGLVQGLGWAALAFLLVMVLGWTIKSLIPGPGIFPTTADTVPPQESLPNLEPLSSPTPSPIPGIEMRDLAEWAFEHPFIAALALPLLIGATGMILGVWQKDWKAILGWLLCLLVVLTILFVLFRLLLQFEGMGLPIWLLPAIYIAEAALLVHLWTRRTFWPAWVLFLLLGTAAGIVVFLVGPWWPIGWFSSTFPGTAQGVLFIGIPYALVWLAGDWRGWPRWAVYIFALPLLAVVLISLLFTEYQISDFPTWLRILYYLGLFAWIFAGTIIIANLVLNTLTKDRTRRQIIMDLILAALLLAGLVVLIRGLTIQDLVAEDGLVAAFAAVLAVLGGIVAAIAMTWQLEGQRKLAAPAFLIVLTLTLGLAARLPQRSADNLTLQRAEAVHQAILRYYERNERYPAALDELTPYYMLSLSGPVSKWRHDWCYQGGRNEEEGDFYRLGYIWQDEPRFPWFVFLRIHAQAGEPPVGGWICDEILEEAEAWISKYNWGRYR